VKVLLDCNIWISLAISRQTDFLVQLYLKNIEIVTCEDLSSEIHDVLRRPKLRKVVPLSIANKIIELHNELTKYYSIEAIPTVISDPKDNYLFALCDTAKVNYFVTGDKLLFSKNPYNNTSIVSLSSFKDLILTSS